MEIVTAYSPQVKKWIHQSIDKFMGYSSQFREYTLGISPNDPQDATCCYFNVGIREGVKNTTINETVFLGEVLFTFKVRNNNRVPSCEFYFDLILEAAKMFQLIYQQKTLQTNLQHRNLPVPQFSELKADIQNCIDTWDTAIRKNSLN